MGMSRNYISLLYIISIAFCIKKTRALKEETPDKPLDVKKSEFKEPTDKINLLPVTELKTNTLLSFTNALTRAYALQKKKEEEDNKKKAEEEKNAKQDNPGDDKEKTNNDPKTGDKITKDALLGSKPEKNNATKLEALLKASKSKTLRNESFLKQRDAPKNIFGF